MGDTAKDIGDANDVRLTRIRYVTDQSQPSLAETRHDEISLQELTRQIEKWSESCDYRVVEAALKLKDLRSRIEVGEAGEGVRWFAWARSNVRLSKQRISELLAIADAVDPNAAVEELRKDVCERVQKCRSKKAAKERDLEPDRRAMRDWLKDASPEDVTIFWRQISRAMDMKYRNN